METPGPEETGSKRDRVALVLLILALLGGLLYARLQSNVFPTASLSLPLSRSEIVQRARSFAGQQGYDGRLWPLDKADGARKKEIESITFTSFDEAKTFLEYELGLSQAGAIMRDKVPVWAWSVRFCREFTIEQCRVWLSPDGALVGYLRTLEEERRLPSLSHQEALYLASDFLKLEGRVQEGTLKLVRDETNARVHRTDHSFTFEDKREDFHGGKLRHFVEVSGNMVTGYNRYLFVPDSWSRKYNNMRSYNELLQRIANIFYSTLQIISALVVPWALSRKQMRWRFAVFGGLTMALTGFLDCVNDFESIQAAYDTTSSYNDYLLAYFGRSGASALGSMLFGGLLFGGADVVYRHFYPGRVALENFLKPAGFFTREGSKALYIGYLVALVHLGWIVLYYLLGEKFSFWCPSGIDSVEVLSATVPFYSAVSLGLHAASQEETVARIVGLSLAWKATGRFWLANLLQAVIWAFMHSSYPQQPCFARGVELTVVGLFYGFVLRRYGLLPCFIGHYLLDAFLDVKPLLSVGPGQLWLWLSSFIPLVPFLLLFFVSLFVTRLRAASPQVDGETSVHETGDAALTNEAVSKSFGTTVATATPVGDSVHDVYVYKGFSRRFRLIAGISSLVLLTITFFIHLPTCGDDARCQIGREQAVTRARLILQKAGINVKNHIAVPVLSANVAMEEMQYLFEQVKRPRTLELSRMTQPGLVWSVSFFRFMDPTEYRVELRADGSEYSLDLKEDDDAPGARLAEEDAKALALAYIRRVHPEYKDFKLSRLSREDEKNRRDYSLDFVVPSLKVGEAEYKFYLQVVGDLPCNFAQAWTIPDSWRYERIKETKQDKIFATVRLYTKVIIVLVLLYWVFCLLRAGVIRWRLPLVVAAVLALVPVLEQINHWPSFMAQYETHLTEATYVFNRFLQLVQHSASVFWQLFLALALSLGAFRILSPRSTFAAILTTAFRPRGLQDRLFQKEMWLDGIIVALCGEALSQLKETLTYFLYYFYSPEIRGAQIDVLCSLSDYFSAVFSDLLDLPQSFLLAIAIYLIGAGMYMKFCRNFWFYMGFCLLYDLIMCSGERHWQDYLIALLSGLINSVIVWFFIAKLAKLNPVAYLLKIVLDDCLPFIYAIYAYGLPAFAPDMVAFLIYLLAPMAVLLYLSLRNRSLSREAPQQMP